MNHTCDVCNYETRDKFNYKKHLLTNKHIEKEAKQLNNSQTTQTIVLNDSAIKFVCGYCKTGFSSSANLARHDKACNKKNQLKNEHSELIEKYELQLKKKDNIIDELNNKIKDINDSRIAMIEAKEEIIDILKEENAFLRILVNNAGNIIKTSVSALSYVIKNYKDVPALEHIKEHLDNSMLNLSDNESSN